MPTRTTYNRRLPRIAVTLPALTLVYVLVGKLSLATAGSAPALWPAAGIALAAMIYLDRRLWLGAALGALLLTLDLDLPPLAALLLALGSALTLLVAADLVYHLGGRRLVSHAGDTIKFTIVAAFASTTISATTGTSALWLGERLAAGDWYTTWVGWWLAEALGILVLTPLLAVWGTLSVQRYRQRWGEALLLTGLLYAGALLLFNGWLQPLISSYPLLFMPLPLMLWAAIRFGPHGAVTATAVIATAVLWGNWRGVESLGPGGWSESLLLVQLYIGFSAVVSYLVGAVSHERSLVQQALSTAGHDLQDLRRRLEQEAAERRQAHQSKQLLTAILDQTSDFVGISDCDGRILYLNRAFRELAGVGDRDARTLRLEDFFPAWAIERFHKETNRAAAADGSWRGELAVRTADGDELMTSQVVIAHRGNNGRIRAFSTIARDISATKTMERELQLAASVFEFSPQAIMISAPDAKVMRVNRSFSRMTGYQPEQVVGKVPELLRAGGGADASLLQRIWQDLQQSGQWCGELSLRRPDGEVYPVWCEITQVRNPQGRVTHYISAFIDITEQKLSQEHIYRLAHYDVLTNLPNRRLLEEHLRHCVNHALRSGNVMALALLNLDQFKVINESLGHGAGDTLLKEAATRLAGLVDQSDIVARWAGDEFALVLPDVGSAQNAAGVADKLLTRLREPFLIGDRELFITASIGLTVAPADGSDARDLLRNADSALHRAKHKGRNQYQFFTEDMNSATGVRLALQSELHKALDQGQLLLHYQPQLEAGGDRIVAVEALLRWQHPERGMVSPGEFIPIAEDSGQIVPITHWVIQTACAQLGQWHAAGLSHLRLAVNISGRSFQDPELAAVIGGALRAGNIPPACLELELTETYLVANPDEAQEILQQLKALGVQIAIDDFGIGYSSLSYLKRFAVDRLKIDRSFVNGLPNDGDDAAIVRAIIAMGKNLQLAITAEGVETPEQLEFLRQEHCDEVQGFHFSRPLPAADCGHLLRQGLPRHSA